MRKVFLVLLFISTSILGQGPEAHGSLVLKENFDNLILKSIVIKTTKKRLWSALTQEEELNHWWNKGVKLEPSIGGEFYEPWGDGQLATGKVIHVKILEEIEFTWQEKYWNLSEETICHFSLKEADGKTILEVKHSGWDTFKDPEYREKLIEGFKSGWDFLLPKLKKYIEESDL